MVRKEQRPSVNMPLFKTVSKYLMAIFYIIAGLNHFLKPASYLKIMPPYLPYPLFLVYLSGLAEMGLGLLLFVDRYSRIGAWGIIALLIAVFPANVQMATHPMSYPEIAPVYLWIRLPLQGVLIAWAYWHARPSRERDR